MRNTSPVLCGVPRTFAMSQLGPMYCAHLRVRLETTTREYHCPGFDLLSPFGAFARHPDHSPRVVPQKAGHLTPVTDLDASPACGGGVLLDEALATAHRSQYESSPKPPLAVYLVRLALMHQTPAYALLVEPTHGLGRLSNEDAR